MLAVHRLRAALPRLTALRQSCHQTSRPACIVTSVPVRFTTTTCSTLGVSRTASSMFAFSGITLPRRYPPSAVMMSLGLAVVHAVRGATRR